MHNRRTKKKLTLALDESGATAIFFAAALSFVCLFVALAFDIGHIIMVKAELQRTADAAALGGVTGFIPYTGSEPQTPNWAQGVTKAHTIISKVANKADNLQFTAADGAIDYGYWKFKPPAGYVQPPTTGLPKVRPSDTEWPEPAISVTLSRDVTLYIAPIFGVSGSKTTSATATAILPEDYGITGVPPIAVSWDTVYDTVGGTTVLDASEQVVKPQSNKGLAGWFNLDTTGHDNSVPSVKFDVPLIADPTIFNTGSQVHMVPGTKATLTDYITQGSTIIVPVVQNDFEQGDIVPIIKWAAFKVDELGANTMTGHFVPISDYLSPDASPDERPVGKPLTPFVSGTPKLVSP